MRAAPGRSGYSAFAPDGRAVAFRGYFGSGDGDYALYTAQAGGCDVRRLTRSIAGNPSWSPNGQWIVFDTSGEGVIWKLLPDATARTRVVRTGGGNADAAPAWSPNGREIAFVRYQKGRGELWLVGADGRDPRLLHRDSRGSVEAPSWSHDGTRIAFPVQTTQRKSIISVIGADGSNLRRLTSPTGDAWNPTWLPGDRGIAYLERAGNTGVVVVIRPGRQRRDPASSPEDRPVFLDRSSATTPLLNLSRRCWISANVKLRADLGPEAYRQNLRRRVFPSAKPDRN